MEAGGRDAKARRAAARRLGDAGAVEEVDLEQAEVRGPGPGGASSSAAAAGTAAAAGDLGEQDRDGGFTPFNFDGERAEGEFTEAGNWVERKVAAEDRDDAWLRSAQVADAAVAKRHAEALASRERGAEEAELSEVELARVKRRLAEQLREGETVAQALKRCGGGQRKIKTKRQKVSAGATPGDPAALERITEGANDLMNAGEHDVYTKTRFQLEHEADMILPRAHFEADGDDMFADDDDAAAPAGNDAPSPSPAPAAARTGAPAEPAAEPAAAAEDATDYASWPVAELKRVLRERGVSAGGIAEKADLVQRVREAVAATAAPTAPGLPDGGRGWAWDGASGYHFHAERQLYFHVESQAYFDGQRWLKEVGGQLQPYQAP